MFYGLLLDVLLLGLLPVVFRMFATPVAAVRETEAPVQSVRQS